MGPTIEGEKMIAQPAKIMTLDKAMQLAEKLNSEADDWQYIVDPIGDGKARIEIINDEGNFVGFI